MHTPSISFRALRWLAPVAAAAALFYALSSGSAVVAHGAEPATVRGQPVAHVAGAWIPNDVGNTETAGGWQKLQWNFGAAEGINAPEAWANLRRDGRPGGQGVTIAVLDTGIAYRDWEQYTKSPDLAGVKFIDPCDLVLGKIVDGQCTDTYPLDRTGHGTWVTSEIAETTNNSIGLTGLAYGATIMPVRVLNADSWGYASTIANGIRYAVAHGAQIINLSLQFYLGVSASDIPALVSAIKYADEKGVFVVAAAGNDSSNQIAYPARAPGAVPVGATTADECLANYSDTGSELDIVAPGGGDDADLSASQCHPNRNLPDDYQMTFNDPSRPADFTLPGGWYGTSMAAPAVSAAAALVIASGVIGKHPSPAAILARLEQTAKPLGTTVPNNDYGYGLLNVGAATSKTIAPPATVPTTTSTNTTPTATTATPTATTAGP